MNAFLATVCHSATGFSAAFIVYGREPRLPTDVINDARLTEAYETQDRTDYADEAMWRLHQAYAQVRQRMANHLAKRQAANAAIDNPKQFALGDRVWLFIPYAPKKRSEVPPKLYRPWKGPCTIIDAKGGLTYKLHFQDGLFTAGHEPHDWVHVARLKPYFDPDATDAARTAVVARVSESSASSRTGTLPPSQPSSAVAAASAAPQVRLTLGDGRQL